jgi:hypothetical protein
MPLRPGTGKQLHDDKLSIEAFVHIAAAGADLSNCSISPVPSVQHAAPPACWPERSSSSSLSART